MIEEYEKLLAQGSGTSMGQEGYGTAFNATMADETEDTLLTKSIVHFAERATAAESKVSCLEERLAALELAASTIQAQQPVYMTPQTAFVGNETNVPTNITYNQQKRTRYDGPKYNSNPPYTQSAPPPAQQQYVPPPGQQQQFQVNQAYSNTIKQFLCLCYCFTCGYDAGHDGFNCPCPKHNHIPYVTRDQAHEVPGACMKAQHKTLPDGTGAGKGWILAHSVTKAQFVMNKAWQNTQQQGYNQPPQQ